MRKTSLLLHSLIKICVRATILIIVGVALHTVLGGLNINYDDYENVDTLRMCLSALTVIIAYMFYCSFAINKTVKELDILTRKLCKR